MWPLATQSNVLMTEQTETFCYSDEGVQGQRVGGEQLPTNRMIITVSSDGPNESLGGEWQY